MIRKIAYRKYWKTMSRSAVESHKGDRYQNLLVAQYIAEMMDEKSGQKIVRMEIESTRVLDGGHAHAG